MHTSAVPLVKKRVLNCLELEFWVVVSHPMWVLRNELGFSVGAVYALIH